MPELKEEHATDAPAPVKMNPLEQAWDGFNTTVKGSLGDFASTIADNIASSTKDLAKAPDSTPLPVSTPTLDEVAQKNNPLMLTAGWAALKDAKINQGIMKGIVQHHEDLVVFVKDARTMLTEDSTEHKEFVSKRDNVVTATSATYGIHKEQSEGLFPLPPKIRVESYDQEEAMGGKIFNYAQQMQFADASLKLADKFKLMMVSSDRTNGGKDLISENPPKHAGSWIAFKDLVNGTCYYAEGKWAKSGTKDVFIVSEIISQTTGECTAPSKPLLLDMSDITCTAAIGLPDETIPHRTTQWDANPQGLRDAVNSLSKRSSAKKPAITPKAQTQDHTPATQKSAFKKLSAKINAPYFACVPHKSSYDLNLSGFDTMKDTKALLDGFKKKDVSDKDAAATQKATDKELKDLSKFLMTLPAPAKGLNKKAP